MSDNAVEGVPNLPSLTKDAWELVELRIWNSFKKRLWIILTATLTVSAIGGLLGLNTLIAYRVDRTLQLERERFSQERERYVETVNSQMVATGILLFLQQRYHSDLRAFLNEAERIRLTLNDKEFEEISKHPAIRHLVDPSTREVRQFGEYEEEIGKLLQAYPTLTFPSADERHGRVRLLLDQQNRVFNHVIALKMSIESVSPHVLGTSRRFWADSIDFYERDVYPKYREVLRARIGIDGFSLSPISSANSLDSDGRKELEPFLRQSSASGLPSR